jgi:hypothetical protein
MSRERILEVVLTMLGAVLLLIASVGKHPYGFYVVLRLVITVGAVYWAWRVYKVGLRAWTWVFVAVALLLNPFFPIRMQRAQWQPIDLCLGILLIGWSGYWLFRGTKERQQVNSDVPFREAVLMVVTAVAMVAAAVVVGNAMRWTLEVCRAHIHPVVLSLTMMVVFTGVLARFVGKRPYRNKVEVIWLGLVCYLSFMLLLSFDVVRDEFGQRYVPGYHSYYSGSYYSDNDDCEGASPDNPCGNVYTYRVHGHLSPTIEGLGLVYLAACIACPWAAYRLWQATQSGRTLMGQNPKAARRSLGIVPAKDGDEL